MIGRNYKVEQEVPKDGNMASSVVLQRDSFKLEADKGVKNCWKWEWFERSVGGNSVGQFIRKIDCRGVARCQLCQNINPTVLVMFVFLDL